MTDRDYDSFTAGMAKLCARFNRRGGDDLEAAYWPSAQRSFQTVASWNFAVQKAIDGAEKFPSPDDLARLRPVQGDRDGHRCSACYETPGWVVSPKVAVHVKGQGVALVDGDESVGARLMRPCQNRTDKRAREFYNSLAGSVD